MLPELKKAIIRYIPDYFGWNETRQEQYRINIPEEIDFKIRQFIIKELFDISVSNDDELDEAWQEMSETQCSKINSTLLPLQGIGEDYFYLNESFSNHKSLLNFETLYDYDFDDYKFQEGWRKKDQKGYKRKPYRGSLYLTWARLMIDGSFTYGTLSMVAGYLFSHLDEFGNEYIDKLIPNEFKHGKNHGKDKGSGYLFDMQTDAKGLEPQLDELKHRFWKYLSTMHERLMDEFDKKSKQQVFILDQSKTEDSNHHFLYTDKKILKSIHFRTFMRNCRAAEQTNHSSITQKLEKEKQLLTKFLDVQYKDIMENFNPKIVKFRKKYKVLIHKDSGLDELLE
jgi:hypothetical protein